jgi:primosomal protein N' (replication factor Y)
MYIYNVAINVPIYQLYSYISEQPLTIGSRVVIEFRNKQVIGFVWQIISKTEIGHLQFPNKLKPILQVYSEELSATLIHLIEFTANYYHYPLGQTVFTALPSILSKNKPINYKTVSKRVKHSVDSSAHNISLNDQQQEIVKHISNHFNQFHPCLLYGVTGSGKTEVYLALTKHALLQNKQVLILVPEINLTPQIAQRFMQRFPETPFSILTSNVTAKQRFNGYYGAINGDIKVIIGTRLSVFTPFKNIGLIIIDEEHDQSFKQSDHLCYHARDLAIWRAKEHNIPVVLGSATPSLESIYNYKQKKYTLYKLANRAVNEATLPHITLLNLNHHKTTNGLTNIVIDEINKRLTLKQQSMIFINRRGFAPTILCAECGAVMKCPNCSANMVVHYSKNKQFLQCHYCNYKINVPQHCLECNNNNLQILGLGTQKIEQQLNDLFPNAKIVRVDRDSTTSKNYFTELYKKIQQNEVDILVGTQILAKGHDFHNLTLVVGVNIDGALHGYNFRNSELLYTQLTQLAGRAGRGTKSGQVILQTYYPQHELYTYLCNNNFNKFVNYILTQRKLFQLPPYTNHVLLKATSVEQIKVISYLQLITAKIMELRLNYVTLFNGQEQSALITIFPVTIPPIHKIYNKERAQILIASTDRNILHKFLNILTTNVLQHNTTSNIKWQLDIDPFEL